MLSHGNWEFGLVIIVIGRKLEQSFIIRICVIITVISSYILSEYALGVNILIADGQ